MALARSDHATSVRTTADNVRISISERTVASAILMLDIVLTAIIAPLTILGPNDPAFGPSTERILPFAIVAPAICLLPPLLMRSGLYHSTILLNFRAQLVIFLRIALYYGFVTIVAALLLHVGPTSFVLLANPLLLTTSALLIHHILWLAVLKLGSRAGYLDARRIVVLFLGASTDANFIGILERVGYRVLGEFSLNAGRPSECVQHALTFASGSGAQELIVAGDYDQLVPSAFEQLTAAALPVYFYPIGSLANLLNRPLWRVVSTPVFALPSVARSGSQQLIKRVTDILLSAVGLLMLSPALAIVAFIIKLDSPGPIIFRQTRAGIHGAAFKIYKFRTMYVWEDGGDVRQASRRDARVTRVGGWLRMTSVDELPQLVNVLKGDMSLVGPRPHALAHDLYYGKLLPKYSIRQTVRPGLTGWAQVNGNRGETPTIDKMAQRLAFDLWYIHHWSEGLDIEIMWRTLVQLVRAPNAY